MAFWAISVKGHQANTDKEPTCPHAHCLTISRHHHGSESGPPFFFFFGSCQGHHIPYCSRADTTLNTNSTCLCSFAQAHLPGMPLPCPSLHVPKESPHLPRCNPCDTMLHYVCVYLRVQERCLIRAISPGPCTGTGREWTQKSMFVERVRSRKDQAFRLMSYTDFIKTWAIL